MLSRYMCRYCAAITKYVVGEETAGHSCTHAVRSSRPTRRRPPPPARQAATLGAAKTSALPTGSYGSPKGSSTKGPGSFNHQLITAAIINDIVSPLLPWITFTQNSPSRTTVAQVLVACSTSRSRRFGVGSTPLRHLDRAADARRPFARILAHVDPASAGAPLRHLVRATDARWPIACSLALVAQASAARPCGTSPEPQTRVGRSLDISLSSHRSRQRAPKATSPTRRRASAARSQSRSHRYSVGSAPLQHLARAVDASRPLARHLALHPPPSPSPPQLLGHSCRPGDLRFTSRDLLFTSPRRLEPAAAARAVPSEPGTTSSHIIAVTLLTVCVNWFNRQRRAQ
ncbi:hypothetical protein T492DRAFT_456671 [Pavlovales sp. CCMP2436]|nr:hypothetical protein T492DRAFT_456671 [Pavlovales sp. CCMP2436]